MSKKTNVNESDFDWTNDIPDNPVSWVEPKITLSNVEKDEEGWPIHEGNGDGEIWIDFERFSNDEKMEIILGIESYLGSQLQIQQGGVRDDRGVRMMECTSNMMKGLLLHCGHEDNHFFATENHVCCMDQNYNEFMEYERNQRPNEGVPERPVVDGGLFLEKGVTLKNNLTEGFYYKGVNPTVDLIVIRGDKVLLIQRGDDAEAEPGKWALPGGFHDTNAKEGEEWKEDKESSLDAAKREVKEETGLDVDSIKGLNFVMVGVYEGGGRDPRDKEDAWTRSTVYMVHIPEDEGEDVKGMDDAQRAEWVPIDKVLQHKLAFDHHKIIEKALTMNESDAFNDLGLLTESNDFEWADIEPTRSDRMNFNKSRFKSHVEYGNDVNLGDRFLATGSPNIWEITMKLPSRHGGDGVRGFVNQGESFHIVTKNEAGKLKHFYWKPTKNPNQVKGTFPHTYRPWKKIVGTIDESNDFKWIEDVPNTTLGELFDNGELSVGDRVHVMGSTKQAEREKSEISISAVFTIDYVGNEFKGITVLTDDDTKRVLDVNIGDDHSDNFSLIDMDRNLMVVKHEKSIDESNDFGWAEDVPKIPLPNVGDKFMWNRGLTLIVITNVEHDGDYMDTVIEFTSVSDNFRDAYEYKNWIEDYEDGVIKPILKENLDWIKDIEFEVTDDYIKSLMSNCKDIQITNYNLNNKSPYLRRGKMNVFYYSMCPYWWELLKDIPNDEDGRGKGEWFKDDDNGKRKVAVIMPDRNGVSINNLRDMDIDDFSAITYDLKGISKYFNGKRGELWILLDDNGDIRYDLIPEHLVDEVRKGFEGVERLTTLEESFDWTEDIPEELDQKLYELIANVIDDEVSQGPYYDQYIQSDSFRKLDTILSKYNIDTGDMSGFFTFGKPTDKNGEYITNYQLYDLKQDLVDAQFMLSDNDAREMLGESDLEWVAETKKYPYVGMKFRYEGKGILYTVTEVTDTLVTIKWIKPKYGGVEQRTTDLSQVEGLIRDKTWVPVINESNDFEWMEDVKPSWLRIGQKFTNINSLKQSRKYEPYDKVQVGTSTFEIYDINDKHGEPHLRFTHNDVMNKRDWERRKGEEIGKNYGGTKFTQAKHNIDTGWWIPLTDCEFIESSHPNLVGKTKPDGSPYGHIYCLPNTSFEHMSNLHESNDFEWTEEVPASDSHRYFDINVCYHYSYDENTGEDECTEGGSYFVKIPVDVVPDIWNFDIDYMAGPGDEGEEVIKWAMDNNFIEFPHLDYFEYVLEISKTVYCKSWGNWNDGDEILCGRNVNESTDFDWAIDDIPPFYTLEWKEHPLAIVGREVWGNLTQQGLTPPENSKFHNLKQARKKFPNGKWVSIVTGPNWVTSAFDDDDLLDGDRLGDNFEVFSSNMEEPEIMTMAGINSYMKLLELES